MGGPYANFNNHARECRRRFAYFAAGRSWPPPRSHARASAALVALLQAPEPLPPHQALLCTGKQETRNTPGLTLLGVNRRSEELKRYVNDVAEALKALKDADDKERAGKAVKEFPHRVKTSLLAQPRSRRHLSQAFKTRENNGYL